MKFLVIQTAFIGDVILSTAIAEKLAAHFPDASIDYVVRKGNESLLDNNPHIRTVYSWDKKSGKYSNLGRIARQVRKEQYDKVVNLQRFFSSGYLTARSGGKEKIGFKKNPLSFAFTKKYDHTIGDGSHEIDRNQRLIADFTDNEPARPRMYPSEKDRKKINVFTDKPFVTMAPASVWFTKQWPMEKWVELIDKLNDYRIILLGGPGDSPLCRSVSDRARHNDIKVLAGNLSFLESATLMETAVMNYTNDSAPLHIASAMNAPVTAIFCSTIPGFGFGPLSDRSTVIETKLDLNCRPCGLHGKKACPLDHFKCATSIKVDEIVTSLRESR